MFSVIFDMDGTLLDTQRICIPAWEYGGRQQGIENLGEHVYNVFGMNSNGSSDYLRTHFPAIDVALFKQHTREYIDKHGVVKFKNGGKDILTFLKKNNVKIALASGTSRMSVEHHIRMVNAEHYFDAIVCGTEVENGKPEPDVFLKAAGIIGSKPQDCFVFEDSENGVKAGHAAGMKVIGIPDVVPFKSEIKKLLFAEHKDFFESIKLLKEYL